MMPIFDRFCSFFGLHLCAHQLTSIKVKSSMRSNVALGRCRGEGDNTVNVCFSKSTAVLQKEYKGFDLNWKRKLYKYGLNRVWCQRVLLQCDDCNAV